MSRPTKQRRSERDERGAALIPLVIATGVVLLIVTAVMNLIVFQYGKGVVRSALDEGARAGSRANATVSDCEARATEVLVSLLGGSLGTGVIVSCSDDGVRVIASATVHFDGWFGSVTDYDASLTASATKENR
jgi:Flp pilus assembly protein TadG